MTQPGKGPAPDLTRLDGLVFLVTGAGSGIGAATAELLGRRGARVAATDLDADAAAETARRIARTGGEALGLAADVTDEREVAAAYDRTLEHFGDLDGAVNCAGTILARPLHETSGAEWDRIMAVNASGVFHSSKHAVLRLLDLGHGGALVTIGSISAVVGLTEQAAYCASKGAVLQLSRQIAVDYAPRGIRSNVVGPGSVHTRILDTYLGGRDDPAAAEREALAAHPLGRLGEPSEIAEAAVFLASPAASFITGANLQADGGYTAL